MSMDRELNFKENEPSVSESLCLKMLVRSSTMTPGSFMSPLKQNGDPSLGPEPEPGRSRWSLDRRSSMDCDDVFASAPDIKYVTKFDDFSSSVSY